MSSIIFHTDEQQAFVATDTLASLITGEPFRFTTKAFIVPHLRLLMCGTGIDGFLGHWFLRVNAGIVKDIDNLNFHTPDTLKELWLKQNHEFSIPEHFTTTVYHFGFSAETGAIRSFAYRSKNDFVSEPVEYGLGFKPECTIPEIFNSSKDIKTMMDEQRSIQVDKPENERVYIGGEILIHHLTQYGYNVYPLARFDDYDLTEQAIYDNFRSDSLQVKN